MDDAQNPQDEQKTGGAKAEASLTPLMRSPEARPYVLLAVAIATSSEKRLESSWAEIVELPLEKRYVWRVANALQ